MQNTKWNLDRALDEYLKQTSGANSSSKSSSDKNSKRSKVIACFDVAKLDEDERRFKNQSEPGKSSSEQSEKSKRNRRSSSPDQIVAVDREDNMADDKSQQHFKIMSWNIDGLDKGNIESRAMGVAKTILRCVFKLFFILISPMYQL